MRRALPVALVALAIATPRLAQAYCRTTTCDPTKGECTPAGAPGCYTGGLPLQWASRCVGWSVQQDAGPTVTPDAFQATADAAFATWQAVSCAGAPISVAFVSSGTVTCSEVEYNDAKANANILLFRRGAWPYAGATNTIALTTVTFDRDTAAILDADMELNAGDNKFTTGDTAISADLQSIITHEAGHFIGFSHSSLPAATMFPSYAKGTTTLRDLDDDDVTVACLAYPPDRQAACAPSPVNGFSADCGAQTSVVPGKTSSPSSGTGCGCGVATAAPLPWLLGLASIASLRRARRRR